MFNRVTLDSEAGTLVSPNGADFDPSTLHDWPNVRDELREVRLTNGARTILRPRFAHLTADN